MFEKISIAWKLWGWFSDNYQMVIVNINAVLIGLIAIAAVIPGPEPEATLQKLLDKLKPYSRKPKEDETVEEPKDTPKG